MTDDHDDDILRRALRAEADGVTADDELLERIRAGSAAARTSALRRRAPWLAAASVAIVAGLTAALLLRDGGDQSVDLVDDPAITSTTLDRAPDLGDLSPAFCSSATDTSDVVVYLDPDVSPLAQATLAELLDADPRVASVDFADQDETLAEFRRLFIDSPELIETVSADLLPPSFRLTLVNGDEADNLGSELEDETGVYEVVRAGDVCDSLAAAERPAQAVAVTATGHVVVLDTATGEVIRDLGGFDDPTDPEVANVEGGPYVITGVALHPNGREAFFETCCEPAGGSIFRVPIDGSVTIDPQALHPFSSGYGMDISADGRWLGFVSAPIVVLMNLETGATSSFGAAGLESGIQVAVNHDGTEVTFEHALERDETDPFAIVRSELITLRRDGNELVRGETTGGDVRLLPIYSDGGRTLTTVAARDGLIDLNVDASGRWFLATPADQPLRGYSEAADEREIPGGSYLAADW